MTVFFNSRVAAAAADGDFQRHYCYLNQYWKQLIVASIIGLADVIIIILPKFNYKIGGFTHWTSGHYRNLIARSCLYFDGVIIIMICDRNRWALVARAYHQVGSQQQHPL